MRPAFARASLRAASSLTSRPSIRPGTAASSSARQCSTSTAPNDPLVKHSSIAGISATESIKASPTDDGHRMAMAAASSSSSSTPTDAESASATPGEDKSPAEHAGIASADDDESPELKSSSSDTEVSEEELKAMIMAAIPGGRTHKDELTPYADEESAAPRALSTNPNVLLQDLRGFIRRNAVRSGLYHYINALKEEDAPAVDKAVLKTVLPILGRYGWAPTALDSVNLALSRDYDLDVGFYNCALHAMSRSGDYTTIQSVIERMWALPESSRPNATSYNYLIGSYMYRGTVDRAFDVLNDMKKHMIYPTFATYHALITGCLRSNDPRRAFTTLTAVERQRFDIGAMTISQVLVACADADLPDEVLQLLPRFEEALPRYGNELHRIAEKRTAYRITAPVVTSGEERAAVRGTPKMEIGAISAMLHCAFRVARADLAVAAWALMHKYYPDVQPSPSLWYCLIGSLAASGDFGKAFEALAKMRESGLAPRFKDLEAALIKPLSVDVKHIDEQYYRLCDRMKEAKGGGAAAVDGGETDDVAASHDVATDVSAVIDEEVAESAEAEASPIGESVGEDAAPADVEALTDEGPVAEAEVPTEEGAISDGLDDLDNGSDKSLRDVLAEKDMMQVLSAEWSGMKPENVTIDEVNCVIAACSIAGDLDRAFQTYDEVKTTFGLERNADTYNALLEGCIQVKHVRGGMRILSEMEKVGMPVSGETVLLMVRLMTRGGKAEDCIRFLEKVSADGGEIPLQSYLLLLRYFVRGNSMHKAVEVLEMGQAAGYSDRVMKGRLDFDGMKRLEAATGVTGEDGNVMRSGFMGVVHRRAEMSESDKMEFVDELDSLPERRDLK